MKDVRRVIGFSLHSHVSSTGSGGFVSSLCLPAANVRGLNLVQARVLCCSLSSSVSEIITGKCSLDYIVNFLAETNHKNHMYIDSFVSTLRNVLTADVGTMIFFMRKHHVSH